MTTNPHRRLDAEVKTCNKCGITQPRENYHSQPNAPDGLCYSCKECAKAKRRRHYDNNPEYYEAYRQSTARFEQLLRRYGIDRLAYEMLLAKQGGVCAICKALPPAKSPLHVDHDHQTGMVRGLLCGKCNRVLVCFGDTAEGLMPLLAYLGIEANIGEGVLEYAR